MNADIIFVKAGTSVTNSANYVGHQAAPSISMSNTASSYSASAPTGYPSSGSFPSGGFYPKPIHNATHPVVPSKCGSGTGAMSTTQSARTTGASPATPTGQALAVACITAQ